MDAGRLEAHRQAGNYRHDTRRRARAKQLLAQAVAAIKSCSHGVGVRSPTA